MHTPPRTRLALLLSLTAILVAAWAAPPASAAPRHPTAGDRITIVVTSDREYNEQVVWYDANNRLRRQSDVPLTVRDPKTRLWSATLTFVSRSPRQKLDVAFGSTGRYARCSVGVDGIQVREKITRGPHALSRCD